MNILHGLVAALPASSEELTRQIRKLRLELASQSGDRLASSHLQLYLSYSAEALQRFRPLRPTLRGIARRHLEEAVAHAAVYPEPLEWLIQLRAADDDHWGVIAAVADYVPKQEYWMSAVKTTAGDGERVKLISALVTGAYARMRLGQFPAARQWLDQAIGSFRRLAEETRVEERALGGTLLDGKSSALMMGFRYQEAIDFIDDVLKDPHFERTPARRRLLVARRLLTDMSQSSQDLKSPASSDALWASLLDKVERCETPDAVTAARSEIESIIRVHSVNQEVQGLAASILRAMQRMKEALLTSMRAPRPAMPEFEPVNSSDITDPQILSYVDSLNATLKSVADEMQQTMESLQSAIRPTSESALRQLDASEERVRSMAEGVYRVRLRNRASWLFWKALRYGIQIVAVAWFLGTVLIKLLEGGLESLFRVFELGGGDLITAVIVLLVGFIAGAAAANKVDGILLPRFKQVLRRIVSDHTSRLWSTYNALLKIMRSVDENSPSAVQTNAATIPPTRSDLGAGVGVGQQAVPQPVDLHAP